MVWMIWRKHSLWWHSSSCVCCSYLKPVDHCFPITVFAFLTIWFVQSEDFLRDCHGQDVCSQANFFCISVRIRQFTFRWLVERGRIVSGFTSYSGLVWDFRMRSEYFPKFLCTKRVNVNLLIPLQKLGKHF